MKKRESVPLSEIIESLEIERSRIELFVSEGWIRPIEDEGGEIFLDARDVDRVRVILNLIDEFEVNPPGVEIILEMRDRLLELQEHFSEVFDELRSNLKREIEPLRQTREKKLEGKRIRIKVK